MKASTYGDDGETWANTTCLTRKLYVEGVDAVLALLPPWRLVEPGTPITAGTRYRIEDESGGCYERTVPAEPDPRVKAVAQVLAEKAGISLDEAEATLVVQALDRMGDDSVTYPTTTTAHHMEDIR